MRTPPGRKKLTWLQALAQRLRLRPTPLGDRGEAHAAKFLRKKGMKIIARNRTHGKGEIDLIALDGPHLVFIEVRTRTTEAFMTPESSIRYAKRKKIVNTVRALLRKHGRAGFTPRIDVIAIIWPPTSKTPTAIRHHRAMIPLASW